MRSMKNLIQGERIRVYYNLHKSTRDNPVYSVQAKRDGRWLVVAHAEEVFLTSVKFQVNMGGFRRVLKERKKNVHAFVTGIYTKLDPESISPRYERITYNPMKGPRFILDHGSWGEGVNEADEALVGRSGVWARSAVWN